MSDRVYCYPGTDILKNKLEIKEQNELNKFERRLTMLRLTELINNPVQGSFDLKHLQKIHKYIFQDIYDWAGEIRKVDIAKGNMFCNVKFIYIQADEIFKNLRKDNYLAGLSKDEFAKKLAWYFSEINALHPFREGNGRTQREFARTLSVKNGYILKFANVSKEEMIRASKTSFLCDYTGMEIIFSKCIE